MISSRFLSVSLYGFGSRPDSKHTQKKATTHVIIAIEKVHLSPEKDLTKVKHGLREIFLLVRSTLNINICCLIFGHVLYFLCIQTMQIYE